jgi:2-keto-4-pentenoate hydratase/2-oxohepta-3-ene-1,7-dioic acid hydratase in catechol pathway
VKIVVFSNSTGNFFIKPDSSLITDSKDFFVPDFFNGISIATAIVIKISKSAKCISSQYAERYYNEFSAGLILYPENLLKTNPGYFTINRVLTADNTAYINDTFHPKEELSKIGQLAFSVDREVKFDFTASNDFLNEINKAIEDITLYSSLKCGDLIMLEINERIPVSEENNIKLSYSERICLDFCIR